MLSIGAYKQRMVRAEEALPGRSTPMQVHNVHHVLGGPLKDAFTGFAQVHLHAEGAAVDLRGAQVNQVLKFFVESLGGNGFADLEQGGENLGNGEVNADGSGVGSGSGSHGISFKKRLKVGCHTVLTIQLCRL